MALKKRISKLKGEQLYVLEILVERLDLPVDNVPDVSSNNLVIRVGFFDLEPFEIWPKDVKLRKERGTENEIYNSTFDGTVNFNSGKSCMFVKTPSDLIKSIRTTPLVIELYHIHSNTLNYPLVNNRVFLGSAKVPLPNCLCDQVIENKIVSLPTSPHNENNVYELTNRENETIGSIYILLKLSCLGSTVVDHFALQGKSFVFDELSFAENNHLLKPRREIKNSKTQQTKTEDISAKSNEVTFTDAMLRFVSTISNLQFERTASFLTRPTSPPRISINEPGFRNLTSAEKLNDSKYRNLVYQSYPDETTCSCLPINPSAHPLRCRSGCTKPCCMSLRNPKSLLTMDEPSASTSENTYCINNQRNNYKNDPHSIIRMRGGGDRKDPYLNFNKPNLPDFEMEYIWRNDNSNTKNRLQGGAEEGQSSDYPLIYPSMTIASNALNENSCAPKSKTDDVNKSRCICAGKESLPVKGSAKCTKKPCMGVDCLIRAFKEAQDFVDSLGKVPGLVGLGLMDPSESPFFGREIDRDYTPREPEKPKSRPSVQPIAPPNLECTAPCNVQIAKLKTIPSGFSIPYAPPVSPMTTVPGRTGVVREAIPTLPDANVVSARQRKKDERREEKIDKQKELDATSSVPLDVDGGPCGEPRCKSRRKKTTDNTSETGESMQKKLTVQAGPINVGKAEKGRHQRGRQHTGGDRNAISKTPIRVSKRVMRYVYTLGDVYPGIVYGHKNCIDPRMRVPANMGWLWNTSATASKLKPRIGWKPGAIGRYLNELLKEAKAGSLEEDNRPRSVPSRGRRAKVYKSMSFASAMKSQTKKESEEEVEAPPTLHIHRKDGTYYVTMYPIKQETMDIPKLEEPMKPLQFKIVKNKDDASVASSSTASDMEIEFSPPAAVNRYRKKPDVIHVDTQVRQQEILDAFKPADGAKKKEKKVKKEKKGRK